MKLCCVAVYFEFDIKDIVREASLYAPCEFRTR